VDLIFNLGPRHYNFCETRHFGSRRLRNVVCRRDRNVTIINKTVNVTKVVYNNSTVYNGGPDVEAVNRRSERRIERLKLERREDDAGVARVEQKNDRLEVVTPTARSARQAKKDWKVAEAGRVGLHSNNEPAGSVSDREQPLRESKLSRRSRNRIDVPATIAEPSGVSQNQSNEISDRPQRDRKQAKIDRPAVEKRVRKAPEVAVSQRPERAVKRTAASNAAQVDKVKVRRGKSFDSKSEEQEEKNHRRH
jgi:hypothetical protein